VSRDQRLLESGLVPCAAAHRAGNAAGRLPDILILRLDRILPDEERPMTDNDHESVSMPRLPAGTFGNDLG